MIAKMKVDYSIPATVLVKRSLGGEQLDPEVMAQMVSDIQERLETIVLRQTYEELTRLGKMKEFREAVNLKRDIDIFFTEEIPNYDTFLEGSLEVAAREIMG